MKVELVADEEIGLGGCVVETSGGSLDARIETQVQHLRETLLKVRRGGEQEDAGAIVNLADYSYAIGQADWVPRCGRVTHSYGVVVESKGPDAFVGEVCEIHPSRNAAVTAEVVGIKDGKMLLMPYGELKGVKLGSQVVATGRPLQIPVGEALLGRVVDAFGAPLDGQPAPKASQSYAISGEPSNPLSRATIHEVLETGVRTIDTLLTIGKGQRVGIFSGSGRRQEHPARNDRFATSRPMSA